MKQKVKIEVQSVDNDAFLLEFAKKANINILVDATDAPTDAPRIDIKQENSIENFALYFAEYRSYTTQRFSTDTLLFWPQYDKTGMAKQLFEANKARWLQQLTASLPPESAKKSALLREHFKKNLGWDGKWDDVDLRIKIKDLPPDLQALVLSELNAQIAYNVTHIDRLLYRLRDDFWQTAKFSIYNGFDYRKNAPASILMLNEKKLNPAQPDALIHPSDVSMEIGELIQRGH